MVCWTHAETGRPDGDREYTIVVSRSGDNGVTWTTPALLFGPTSAGKCVPTSVFAHTDGTLSCLVSAPEKPGAEWRTPRFVRSRDGGETWKVEEELLVAGRSLAPYTSAYSPMGRLSDGTVVMTGYEWKPAPGTQGRTSAERLDRSLLFRSSDDGYTFGEAVYFDQTNFDHNECMVAEVEPGTLVAFMRTLRAPTMWMSRSNDSGKSWDPLRPSDVSGECPYLVYHSSGTLIMFNRGEGSFVRLSTDRGASWSEQYRISPCSAMIGMTEVGDGLMMIVMHEGFRTPGYIRGQIFRIAREGGRAEPVAVAPKTTRLPHDYEQR